MSRTLGSPRHLAVARLLTEKRKAAHLTQAAVAKTLSRHQSFVATIERGQRRVDVVEFFDFATAIGFDPIKALAEL